VAAGLSLLVWTKVASKKDKADDSSESDSTKAASSASAHYAGRQRVHTPMGFGLLSKTQTSGSDMVVVELAGNVTGRFEKKDVKKLATEEPIWVTTPFGHGKLLSPIQTTPDLVPTARDGMFEVKLDDATAWLHLESVRFATYNPYPKVYVETSTGVSGFGIVVEPAQTSAVLTPKPAYGVQLDGHPGELVYAKPSEVKVCQGAAVYDTL